MVTIAMASSIILTGAYVASRADGTVVGANLASSSDARNRVESALAITADLLSQDEDWRVNHLNGVIIDDQSAEHGISVRLTDLATGGAPNIETVDVRADIIGRAGAIERIAEATFFVPLPAQGMSLDLDLGEFALFAGGQIQIYSEAVVAPWDASPASHRGDPIRIATMLGQNSGISITGNAAVVDGVEFSPNSRSVGSGSLPVSNLPDQISVPDPAPPEIHSDATFVSQIPERIYGNMQTDDVEINDGDVHELFAGSSLFIDGDLDMESGATLRISGTSEIVVTGDVTLDQATIEVSLESGLTMHIGGNLEVRDSFIHEPGGTSDDWVADIDRIRFVSMATREAIPVWKFRGCTLMKGECYAPSARIVMREQAMLIGRILAQKIKLDGCAQLLYDPSLDDRNGYTAPDGRLFDDSGRVPEAIREIETLAPAELVEASLKMNTMVVANSLSSNALSEAIEEPCADDRRTRRERRSERKAQRMQRVRAFMHETLSEFAEISSTHMQETLQMYAPQTSMRINAIGNRSSSSHGGR
jgi:hypothetical protein